MWLAIVQQALATMRQHRRWAVLTMFGIVWGTASVVLLVGWGIGVHAMVDDGMQKVGKNLVFIMPGRIGEDLSAADERRVLHFDLDDAAAVRRAARHVDALSAEIALWRYVRHGGRGRTIDVRGIEPEMQDLRGSVMAAGRFITADDLRFHRRVAVIGQTARERLLGARPAMGARLNLDGSSFEVVGVLDARRHAAQPRTAAPSTSRSGSRSPRR